MDASIALMATIRKQGSLNRVIKQKMTTKNNLILIRYFTFLFVFNFFSLITKAQNAHKIERETKIEMILALVYLYHL